MANVLVTELAKADVRDILTNLNARAGFKVASQYAEDFKAAYGAIAQFPGLGAPRPKLGPKARIRVVSPYVVIYDHDNDGAIVLRVLHGHRKITRRLVRPKS
jgi:toxin ParE1/3/4